MPTLSRYFIKTAFLHLILGLMLSILVLAQSLFKLPPYLASFRPVYIHLITIGWLTQLIMGVAYWMFPKMSKEAPRGNQVLGWAAYLALNIGLGLRAVGEPLMILAPNQGYGFLLLLSGISLAVGAWAFVLNTWQRVRER